MLDTWLKDGLIIASVTAWFNIIFFFYVGAYCRTFKIPVDFIKPSLVGIMNCVTTVMIKTLIPLLPIYIIIALIKNNFAFLKMYYSLTVALIFVLSLLVAYLSGIFRAKTMTEFVVIQEDPKLVVLYNTDGFLLCKRYDELGRKITDDLVLKKITDESIIMKIEKLRELEIIKRANNYKNSLHE